ncbi:MAG: thioredoxin [Clostridiales bacterium]|jgi:thioredoxin 1|nr:thioredoxin [Clostridiales bacterium]
MANIINSASFASEVLQADKPVLVDFYADWCGPCKMVAPIIEEIAAENAETVKVCKINVDDSPDIAGMFGIMSIPTLMLFKDGKEADRIVGAYPKEEILNFLNK